MFFEHRRHKCGHKKTPAFRQVLPGAGLRRFFARFNQAIFRFYLNPRTSCRSRQKILIRITPANAGKVNLRTWWT